MKERRKLERFELHLPAEIIAQHQGQNRETTTLFTRDISAFGAFFPTPDAYPEGTPVQVALNLTIGNQQTGVRARVRVDGVVARSSSSGMAITFYEKYQMTPFKSNVVDWCSRARRPS